MQQLKKVFCLGELLLRMSPADNDEWIQRSSMPTYIGGAELNVARALTKWDMPVRYCTALPDNFVAKQIIENLAGVGIDTSAIKNSGDRIGIYYMMQGADLKNAGVVYDRSNSSFACLQPGELNWDEILDGVDWFHFSAITPALSSSMAAVCLEGLKAAMEKKIPVSVDLNYRAKLWKYGKTPLEIMPELVSYCDVVMGNVWAANVMLGIPLDDNLAASNEHVDYLKQATLTSSEIQSRNPKCTLVANTYRFSADDEDGINYYATLYADNTLFHSTTYHSSSVIDKSGSGDCFMAGLIYSSRNKFSFQETIDFATAAAFSKLFVHGDATNLSVNEIQNKIQK